jgi:hypothetical protein
MNDRLTIRLATDADRPRVERLAQLDSRRAPHGDVLVAELDGRLVAAVGMDGSAVADPFQRTAAVVRLLRDQLDGKPARRRTRGRLFGRPAPAA